MTTQCTSVRLVGSAGIPKNKILGNLSGATNWAEAITVSDLLDSLYGATQGTLLFRSASGWTVLAPGKKNAKLASGGPGQDPFWA